MNIRYYYFIDEFNKKEIEKLSSQISLIYRNYNKKNEGEAIYYSHKMDEKSSKEYNEIQDENNEDENIDYTTLFDQLNFYYEHPINLNQKEIKFDLEQLMILDQFQIKSLILVYPYLLHII